MSRIKKISYNKLKKECKLNSFKFQDTSELKFSNDIIGQERAVKAMEFGLKIKARGYNIYMSGMTGTGKTSYAQNIAKKISKKSRTPDDWCYVYNFDNINRPKAINLPAGLGKVFQKDMRDFVKVLKIEISKAFNSEDYEKEKTTIAKEYQTKKAELMEKLNEDAEKQGFKVKTTNTGIYFLPIVEGKTISEEDYGDLDEKVKQEINEKSNQIQLGTLEIIRQIKSMEKEAEERVAEWENRMALFAVGMQINDLKEKYRDYKMILDYLEKVQEDILKNLDEFREDELSEEQQLLLPWLKASDESHTDKYKINLLVDNSELEGVPIITDYNPTYYNLLGKVEHENEFGTMITDFTMIKSGLFHQANGGYLILQAKDILNNIQSWEALKRVLRAREIAIENMKEQMGLIAISTLKPEPIPVDIKVILVGSEYIFQVLYQYDEEFRKFFKIKVDFDADMDRNNANIRKLARFIGSFCNKEEFLHFDKTGVAKVVEYSSRLVEDQNKLSTRFNDIVEILSESVAWAEIEKCSLVSGEHVKKAIQEKIYRSNKYDKKLLKLLENGTIMLDTKGEVIGQINALTIVDTGDYSFGKPSRITANTFMGEKGIVNIEREVEISGTSHSKGIMILSGYIGQRYAQDIPLSLTASLCFEQLYGGIDGDSASSAELYAVLSSLAEVPIKQNFAVTGSVNQKGEIQPIGGVTEKIEGFFELCKLRGLNGEHGVIIPHQNIKNLVLNDEVVEACREGSFNVYAVKTIDEGIELLTGKKAGNKNQNGKYPAGTINYFVYEKLKKFSKAASNITSNITSNIRKDTIK